MAIRELRRRPRSFLVPVSILALLALLLLYPSSILDGILIETSAGVRNAPADLIVYSRQANGVLPRSSIEPAMRDRIAGVPGVGSVAPFDVAVLTGLAQGVAQPLGFALTTSGSPPGGRAPAPGEAFADDSLRERSGLREGARIELGPGRTPVTVVGFVSGTNLWFANGLHVHKSTWISAQNPVPVDPAVLAGAESAASQVLLVSVAPGASESTVATAVDEATGGQTQTMTRQRAIDTMPGNREQETMFGFLRAVTIVVALVVVALFLSFMTLERAPMYAALKAIGASSRQLFGAVVLQVVLITALAIALAALFTYSLTRLPADVPTVMRAGRVIETTSALFITAVVGSCLSLRRVVRVDAKSALG
jgi:putative ABC transport system permease protein